MEPRTVIQNQSLRKCARLFTQFSSSVLSWYLGLPVILMDHVAPVLRNGLTAVRSHLANKRHVMGDAFLVVGVGCIFLHKLFPIDPWMKGWYYTNWYYYFEDQFWGYCLLFWSVTAYMYASEKSGRIIFFVLHVAGWLCVYHFYFEVYDYNSYHSFPIWYAWILCLTLATGFITVVDHLVYVWEHKTKGILCRFVGLVEVDIPLASKEVHFKTLAKEYRQLNEKY